MIHLALHGYADEDYPDRSALVFRARSYGNRRRSAAGARNPQPHLDAKLVTLSACNTGVGPTGAADVDNIVTAFIEAGADTVVSTLWDLEDHSTEHLMSVFYSQLALPPSQGGCAAHGSTGSPQSGASAVLLGQLPNRRRPRRHHLNLSRTPNEPD